MYQRVLGRFFAAVVLCAPFASNAAWINGLVAGQIRSVGKTGAVTFRPSGTPVESSCGYADFYIITPSNNPAQALAILLAAVGQGRHVNIYVPDDSTRCDPATGRPTFTDIMTE